MLPPIIDKNVKTGVYNGAAELLTAGGGGDREDNCANVKATRCEHCQEEHKNEIMSFKCPKCIGDVRFYVCGASCQKAFWKKHKAECH